MNRPQKRGGGKKNKLLVLSLTAVATETIKREARLSEIFQHISFINAH